MSFLPCLVTYLGDPRVYTVVFSDIRNDSQSAVFTWFTKQWHKPLKTKLFCDSFSLI